MFAKTTNLLVILSYSLPHDSCGSQVFKKYYSKKKSTGKQKEVLKNVIVIN